MDDTDHTNVAPIGTLESTAISFGVAALAGFGAFVMLMLLADWTFLQAVFGGAVIAALLGLVLVATVGRPLAPVTDVQGRVQKPTEGTIARATMTGRPGEAAHPHPADQARTRAPSPHKTEIDHSTISDTRNIALESPTTNKSVSPGPGGTPAAEAAPATRIPSPAPINAEEAAVARPVGATTNPSRQINPTPFHGRVVSPEPPVPLSDDVTYASRNDAAPSGGTRPAPTATAEAQSYNEVDPIASATAGGAAGGLAMDGTQAAPVRGAGDTGGAETTAGSRGGDNVADGDAVTARTANPAEGTGTSSGATASGGTSDAYAAVPLRTPSVTDEADRVESAPQPIARVPEAGGDDVETSRDMAATSAGSGTGATAGSTPSMADEVDRAASAPGAKDGVKPDLLSEARDGGPDDLKRIRGVGPKLEAMLHDMGVFHFDQVASWGPGEVAWVDENLEGFKGRVSRDEWVDQARHLASGGETDFSRRVDDGTVY